MIDAVDELATECAWTLKPMCNNTLAVGKVAETETDVDESGAVSPPRARRNTLSDSTTPSARNFSDA